MASKRVQVVELSGTGEPLVEPLVLGGNPSAGCVGIVRFALLVDTVPKKSSTRWLAWPQMGTQAFRVSHVRARGLRGGNGAAFVDSIGQTAYVLLQVGLDELLAALVCCAAAMVAFAAGARRLATAFLDKGNASRPRIPLKVAAGFIALIVFVGWLTVVNVISHGIAWEWGMPQHIPSGLVANVDDRKDDAIGCRVCVGDGEARKLKVVSCESCITYGRSDVPTIAVWLGGLIVLCLVLGWYRGFLNGSTLQPLYRARITRAFLGASNPRRVGPGSYNPVTRVIKGDDADVAWATNSGGEGHFAHFAKGAPLHFVNVTVNENLDNKTRLQRSERGGIGMAIGPAGISAGVRHHVIVREAQVKTGI